MTPYEEEQFLRMSPADQQRSIELLEVIVSLINAQIELEGEMALNRLCQTYGIK